MIIRFVEEKITPDDGQVNHALRGALSCLIKDYLVLQNSLIFLQDLLNLKYLSLDIHRTTGERANQRKIKFTETVVLCAANNDNNVSTKSHNFYYI